MNATELRDILLEELDFTDAPGYQKTLPWPNGRPIPHIHSAYCIQENPVVYFGQLEEVNATSVAQLYRRVWSQGKAPLLYVISRQDIWVYNGYDEPPPPENPGDIFSDEERQNRLLHHLQSLDNVEAARQKIVETLNDYKRIYLDTGAFWQTRDGQKIDREGRADKRLLKSLDQLRRRLIESLPGDEEDTASEIAYALLGRSIFICYLQDRGVLTEERIAQITGGHVRDYKDALDSKDITYRLFDFLNDRFNGDIFPVEDEEREVVNENHLHLLKRFLHRDDMQTMQMSFWPYDFSCIPIELISGIYDTFLSNETRKTLGAYYTPLPLVDFMIEETMPLQKTHSDMRILDPACGSGIFLVRAYQRLIASWKHNTGELPPVPQLSDIMQKSIFGVDIQGNATRIAAFSLCLAMLDYIENEAVWQDTFKFPALRKTNLISANFFSKGIDSRFANIKFDRIVGNPPWGKNTLQGEALEWIKEREYPTGEGQLVQAFLYRAPLFCAEQGEIALLAPVKSTIIVTSDTHQQFRQKFFEMYTMRAIVNFSTLLGELFKSFSPVVVLFFRPQLPTGNNKIVYGVPKPTALSQNTGAIILDASEIKYLELEELFQYPLLWKIAQWGTPRDEAFIRHLQTFPTLEQQREKLGWNEMEAGFIVAKKHKKKEALWLHGLPVIDTDKFQAYTVKAHGTVQETFFERPRSESAYTAPLVAIRRGKCEAALLETGQIAYRDTISGVPGKPEHVYILKWLTAYINSSLARYYHFLTSSRWGVERGVGTHSEYKNMPFLIPDENNAQLQEIIHRFDTTVALIEQRDKEAIFTSLYDAEIETEKKRIDDLVFKLYDLTPVERQLVHDMTAYEIPFFEQSERKQRQPGSRADAIKRPETHMLVEYAGAFIEIATLFLQYRGQTLNATVYNDGVPLNVVEFELTSSKNASEVRTIAVSDTVHTLLRTLDQRLREQYTSTLYTRRHVRIFDGPRFYLVRPGERRLWTRSQAYADADSFVAELVSRAKKTKTGATS